MAIHACHTCTWWNMTAGSRDPEPVGQCRRRAPSTSSTKPWPIINAADFCGEHEQARPEHIWAESDKTISSDVAFVRLQT